MPVLEMFKCSYSLYDTHVHWTTGSRKGSHHNHSPEIYIFLKECHACCPHRSFLSIRTSVENRKSIHINKDTRESKRDSCVWQGGLWGPQTKHFLWCLKLYASTSATQQTGVLTLYCTSCSLYWLVAFPPTMWVGRCRLLLWGMLCTHSTVLSYHGHLWEVEGGWEYTQILLPEMCAAKEGRLPMKGAALTHRDLGNRKTSGCCCFPCNS